MARPVDKNIAPATGGRSGKPVLTTIGVNGLNQGFGILWEEKEPALRGRQGMLTYQRISHEPIVAACLHAIDTVIRGVEWTVEPAKPEEDDPEADATPEAEKEAEWVKTMLLENPGLSWEDTISEIVSFLVYGYSLFEIIYEIGEDGLIVISDLAPRPQETIERWEFDDSDRVTAAIQKDFSTNNLRTSGRELRLPLEKCLHFVFRQRKRNPEGSSILRPAWKPWRRKERLQIISDIGTERDLTGVPVLKIPAQILNKASAANATAQDIAVLESYKKLVRDVRMNEQAGIILPSDPFRNERGEPVAGGAAYDLMLLASNSSRNVDIEPKLDRCEAEMARLMLADFLLLGKGAAGSFAMSADKTDFFSESMNAILRLIQGVVNNKAIARVFALNGKDPKNKPTLKAGEIKPDDVAVLASTIGALASAGAEFFPDDTLENNLRRRLELPPKPAGGIQQPMDPGLPGDPGQQPPAPRAGGNVTPIRKPATQRPPRRA